ncbi:MAG: DNA-processing protein DprA [Methanosarcinales archaeon]|nr:DNA-processing protein DprA [Methanosarcinales archaeon]
MEPISILALEETPMVGLKTIEKVLSISPGFELNSPSDVIEILKKANAAFKRISIPNTQDATIGWNKAHEIWKLSQQHNIRIIPRYSPHYPKSLSQISNPPALLHISGNIDAINRECIAIVGTREPTDYGITAAKKLGALFAEKGYTVVSGLANGIDAAAHQGALEVNGLTVAVLAHGLDTVYPVKNKELADAILKNNGALVSEYPWGTKANRSRFVARDRIQSGLSLGIFVVETGTKGGTLHTVKYCKQQKRTLIILKHPPHLIGHPKTCGNAQLISEERADIVFENDDSIDVVIIEMDRVKDELLACRDKESNNRTNPIQMTLG